MPKASVFVLQDDWQWGPPLPVGKEHLGIESTTWLYIASQKASLSRSSFSLKWHHEVDIRSPAPVLPVISSPAAGGDQACLSFSPPVSVSCIRTCNLRGPPLLSWHPTDSPGPWGPRLSGLSPCLWSVCFTSSQSRDTWREFILK